MDINEQVKQEHEFWESHKKLGFWTEYPNSWFNPGWKDKEKIEIRACLKYIEDSKITSSYMGWANCRVCGIELGSSDMVTPDDKWIFPEKYEHYLIEHHVQPIEEFILDAVAYYKVTFQ